MNAKEIYSLCMQIAPLDTQENWDNSGKQIFFEHSNVKQILLATDFTKAVAYEAVKLKCEMVIVHHPLIFKPLKLLDFTNPILEPLLIAIQNKISVIALHTNYDCCPTGMNEFVLQKIGVKSTRPLLMQSGNYLKLIVFCPKSHFEKVRDAICNAGAGHIGNYSHCTFNTSGTGTFKGNDLTNPYIGKANTLEFADEIRLETILPETKKKAVVQAMLQAHPYEEVAFDLVALRNEKPGLGRVGILEKEYTSTDFSKLIKNKLKLKSIDFIARKGKIKTVGIVTGGAGKFYIDAFHKNCDAFISGDIKHNEWLEAKALNLMLIDASHFGTEKFFAESFIKNLNSFAPSTLPKMIKSKQENLPYETL